MGELGVKKSVMLTHTDCMSYLGLAFCLVPASAASLGLCYPFVALMW